MKSFKISMQSKGKTGVIDIFGVIGSGFFSDVNVGSFKRELTALGDITRLDVHIHSPGGEILEGTAIFNAIRQHKATVHTFVDGLAGSMASVLVLAGDTRHIAANAWIMVHNPSAFVQGTAREMKRAQKVLKQHTKAMVKTYADHTDLSRKEVQKLMDEGTWLDAEDSLDKGFVDQIDDEVKLDAVALADLSKFKNAPAVLLAASMGPGTPGKTDEESEMDNITLEMVRKCPNIIEALQTEFKTQADANMAAAVVAALDAELSRVKEVMSLHRPGMEDLVMEMALDGNTTKAEAALKMVEKMDALGKDKFEDRKKDSNDTQKPDGGNDKDKTDMSNMSIEERAKVMWAKNIGGCRDGSEAFYDEEGLAAYLTAQGENRFKIRRSATNEEDV